MTGSKGRSGSKRRSPDQRRWNAAVARASMAWEYLSDEQRLRWTVAAKEWRMTGQRYFVKVNARRILDGQDVLTEPPEHRRREVKRVLKQFVIIKQRSRVTLKLQVAPVRGARYTVWGSLPCTMGVERCFNCPRLGPLPMPRSGWCEITELYFRKHGDYIVDHELPVVGKRIYIRVREERDDGPTLYEEKRAVVPIQAGEGR